MSVVDDEPSGAEEIEGDLLEPVADEEGSAGDVFVSVARGLGKAAGWSMREAAELGDAARAATTTTREVSVALVELFRPPPPDPQAGDESRRLVEELKEVLARHGHEGFSTVADRRRFWQIVDELHRSLSKRG